MMRNPTCQHTIRGRHDLVGLTSLNRAFAGQEID
jgi:hypothetical protein